MSACYCSRASLLGCRVGLGVLAAPPLSPPLLPRVLTPNPHPPTRTYTGEEARLPLPLDPAHLRGRAAVRDELLEVRAPGPWTDGRTHIHGGGKKAPPSHTHTLTHSYICFQFSLPPPQRNANPNNRSSPHHTTSHHYTHHLPVRGFFARLTPPTPHHAHHQPVRGLPARLTPPTPHHAHHLPACLPACLQVHPGPAPRQHHAGPQGAVGPGRHGALQLQGRGGDGAIDPGAEHEMMMGG